MEREGGEERVKKVERGGGGEGKESGEWGEGEGKESGGGYGKWRGGGGRRG